MHDLHWCPSSFLTKLQASSFSFCHKPELYKRINQNLANFLVLFRVRWFWRVMFSINIVSLLQPMLFAFASFFLLPTFIFHFQLFYLLPTFFLLPTSFFTSNFFFQCQLLFYFQLFFPPTETAVMYYVGLCLDVIE